MSKVLIIGRFRAFPKIYASFCALYIRLKYVDGQYFVIDFVNRTILNLNAYGFDIKRLQSKKQHLQQVRLPSGRTKAPNLLRQRGGSTDTNREWEVGLSSYEVDDERKYKQQ